jgi:large subunit ribosomal protein L35
MKQMKQKTKKGLAKRTKVTGTGKILHGHANTSHNRSKKSNARLRRQDEPEVFKGKFKKTARRLLGI